MLRLSWTRSGNGVAVIEATGFREQVTSRIEQLHERATELFTQLDRGGTFREDRWERPGGGGGVSRMLTDGATFEKAGVNRSVVEGVLAPQLAQRIGARASGAEPSRFFVTGMSLVVHPRSPMVPTVHLNVRYFEITDPLGSPVDAWFGGRMLVRLKDSKNTELQVARDRVASLKKQLGI